MSVCKRCSFFVLRPCLSQAAAKDARSKRLSHPPKRQLHPDDALDVVKPVPLLEQSSKCKPPLPMPKGTKEYLKTLQCPKDPVEKAGWICFSFLILP